MQKRYAIFIGIVVSVFSYGMEDVDNDQTAANYYPRNRYYIVEFDLFTKEISTDVIKKIGVYYRILYCSKKNQEGRVKSLPYREGEGNGIPRIGEIVAHVNEKTKKQYIIVPEEHCTSHESVARYYRTKPYYDAQEKWEQHRKGQHSGVSSNDNTNNNND